MARGAANKGDVNSHRNSRAITHDGGCGSRDALRGGLGDVSRGRGDGSSFSPYVTSRSVGGEGGEREKILCTVLREEGHHLSFFFVSLALAHSPFSHASTSLLSVAHDENAETAREGDDRAKQLLVASARGGPARGQREKRQAGASERVHWLYAITERPTRKSSAVGRRGGVVGHDT